jgi:hypothetical protein
MDDKKAKILKEALIDPTTEASLQGNTNCNFFKYSLHYPTWPLLLTLGFANCVWLTFMRPSVISVVLLLINSAALLIYYNRIRVFCYFGDLCAAKVVSVKPMRIAVYTDMGNSGPVYKVIKIIEAPIKSSGGKRLEVGDTLPVAALYQQSTDNDERWSDFTPKPLQCFTFDTEQVNNAKERIPQELWDELERGLTSDAVDINRIGLYDV